MNLIDKLKNSMYGFLKNNRSFSMVIFVPKFFFYLLTFILYLFQNNSIFANSNSIEIILSSDNSIYERGLYGIQSVIDREVKISYLDIILSESDGVESYFQNLENTDVPLVITIGPQATKIALQYLNKTPIIFSMVSNPKSLGLERNNLCGVSMDVSVEEFFQTLNDIDPRIKNVKGFYSSKETHYSAEEGNFVDLKYKLLYKPFLVTPENFTEKLEEIKNTTDAFYMISDPIYNQQRFAELSDFSKRNGIILMTSFPTLVKVGATFAISPEYSKIGVETGMMANRILNRSSDCSKERVLLPNQSAFYLNEDYAMESGTNIPETIKERAKLTKLFAAGISLLNEEKLKSARKVFEAILKKDPNNRSAQTYQSLVIEKMTGTRTKELLKNGERFFNNKQYSSAKGEFQKVLAINPNHKAAKEGYEKSILSQSEQERIQGKILENSGKPFLAIKSYLSSLRTLPGNNNTLSDLNQLRKSESKQIPEYLKNGISVYNERKYDEAIVNFENILLIEPNEKTAKEYLRLSYKKKEAIEILKKKLNNNK